MKQYPAKYLFITSTENKQLWHKFFIKVVSLYLLLSNWECQAHYEEGSDLGSECVDDMEEPQFGPTFF